MSDITDDRLREIVGAFAPAECDADHCDDPYCPLIHYNSCGDFTREEYEMARELLERRSSIPQQAKEGWQHETPFITMVSQPDGKRFVSVAVHSLDALHDAHDLIISAFKAAGAS